METHKPVIDIPCRRCSHNESNHVGLSAGTEIASANRYCVGCYNSLGEESCFHDFEADNLKYLELCVEQKELNA